MTDGGAILCDVDGTLVDSNYLHTIAWSRALSDAGEWAPMHAIHRLVGMGGDQLVPRLLGHEAPRAVEARPAHYRALLAEVRPFPRAAEFLRRVHELGLRVAIATSAPKDELEAALAVLGAGPALDAQTTADDVSRSKPEPDVFNVALRQLGCGSARALVLADSVWDVEAARAAGVGCVGVETGGFSRHELAEAGAVQVYRNVGEVLDQLETGPFAALLHAGRA